MEYKKTNILRLINTVFKKVQKKQLFNSQNDLLITFSGGQDSALCLLVLFVLKEKTNLAWDRKKLLDFSKQNQREAALIKHLLAVAMQNQGVVKTEFLQMLYLQMLCVAKLRFATQSKASKALTGTFAQPLFVRAYVHCVPCNLNLVKYPCAVPLKLIPQKLLQEKKISQLLFSQKRMAYHLIHSSVTNYTLLWCNHFWQKQSFFTMEHVSRFIFCKGYAIHFFIPVKTVLSEQDARNWRHRVMQRSSLFIRSRDRLYDRIELYFNLVSTTYLRNSTVRNRDTTNTKTNKISFSLQQAKPGNGFNTAPQLKQLCVQGHTKSDRAESILFNIIKGTGMNGISTLQWKQTFLSSCHSNNVFYPIFSDFFKEIRVLCLQSLFVTSYSQKTAAQMPCLQIFDLQSRANTFYYQLKYKSRDIE